MRLVLVLICVLFVAGVSCPFFVPSEWNLNTVIADAAKYYGLDEDEYTVVFTSKVRLYAQTEGETGEIGLKIDEMAHGIYTVKVEKTFSRPNTIAVIFHEFAHAAQHKYAMDLGGIGAEKHAEMMAYNAMLHTKYRWDASHMLLSHTFRIKPKNYLATRPMWRAFLCGTNIVDFRGEI